MSAERLAAMEDSIRALLRTELASPQLELASDEVLANLGLSSMRMIRLVAKLEKAHGVELDDEAVFGVETLHDLAELILRAGG